MIETDETGNEQLSEIFRYRDSKVFNDWEQRFINDLLKRRVRYSQLTKHERTVVSRLYGWLKGDDPNDDSITTG